jgi:hypothetical protein
MTKFEYTLNDVNSFCKKEGIPYAIIGGIALLGHGINKTTEDIDITLMLNLEEIKTVGEKILKQFESIHPNPINFFETNFVLPVIHKETKIGIDFAAGLSGFDSQVIERRVHLKFGSLILPFASIEDLIVYKLFAARNKDFIDLRNIAQDFTNTLDYNYTRKVLKEFGELERDDMMENFKKIFI